MRKHEKKDNHKSRTLLSSPLEPEARVKSIANQLLNKRGKSTISWKDIQSSESEAIDEKYIASGSNDQTSIGLEAKG